MCIVFIELSKGCHIFQSHIYSMFLRVQVSQDPCFLRSRIFRVQVFLALGPGFRSRVGHRFKFLTFHFYAKFFFFKYQRKKIHRPNLIITLNFSFMLWCLVFPYQGLHENLKKYYIYYNPCIKGQFSLFWPCQMRIVPWLITSESIMLTQNFLLS